MQLLKMGRAEDPLPPQKLPDYRLSPGPVDRIGELPVFLSNLLRIVHVRRRRRTQDRQTCAVGMCFRSPDHPVASCQGRTVNERRQVLLCPYGTLVLVIRPHWIANDVMISVYPAPRGVAPFDKELAAYKGGKGTVQFPLTGSLPEALIKKIVAFRLQEVKGPKKSAAKSQI